MLSMYIGPVVSIILAMVVLSIGYIVIINNPKEKTSILFAIMCLLLGLFYFLYIGLWWINNAKLFYYVFRIALLALLFYYFIMPIFYACYTNTRLTLLRIIIWCIPVVLITVCTFNCESAFHFNGKGTTQWNIRLTLNIVEISYMLYNYSSAIASTIMVYIWSRKSVLKKYRLQGKVIFHLLMLTTLASILLDLILQVGSERFIPVWPFLNAIYIFGLCICLVRYRFMISNISDVADEILFHVKGFVMIIQPDEKINNANEYFTKFVAKRDVNYLNQIIVRNDVIDEKMKKLFNGSINHFEEKIQYRIGSDIIYTQTNCSRIVDKIGDFIGMLVVSKEIPGVNEFRNNYNITNRQFEIINMIIQGMTNMDMVDRLGLCRRTVETHINNIYIKLRVKNRVEMLKIARQYDIF